MNSLLTSLRSLLLIATFAFVVVACKKDSDPEPSTSEIKGTWTIKSVKVDPSDSSIGGIIEELDESSCKSKINIAFADGGSVGVTAPNDCLTQLFYVSMFVSSNSKWEVKNDKLILSEDGEAFEFDMTVSGSDVTLVTQQLAGTEEVKLTLVLTRK